MAELQQAFITGAIGILVTVVTIIFNTLNKMLIEKIDSLKAKKTKDEYDTILKIARTAVNATEQIFTDLKGVEKLQKALTFAQRELEKVDIHISDRQLAPILEAAVKGMNDLKSNVE